jgi:hypothetical protein
MVYFLQIYFQTNPLYSWWFDLLKKVIFEPTRSVLDGFINKKKVIFSHPAQLSMVWLLQKVIFEPFRSPKPKIFRYHLAKIHLPASSL